ncbi:MAG: tetratricopeptide repeat protein [Acidobacteriaceae bacterium]|jgi:CHAT domain-containing protein
MNTANPAKTILIAGLFLVSLPACPQQAGSLHGLIAAHEQALADARASHNVRGEATELNALANLYREAGDPQKGLDYCAQALAIETGKGQQAQTKNVEGRILTDLGQEQKALDLFTEILPIWKQLNILMGEASTLTNMGRVYNDLGQRDKAIEVLNQALPMWRQLNNHAGEANALDNLGRCYSDMGRSQEALDHLNQALPLWRASGEIGGEAQTLNNLGRTYTNLGEKEKALESYQAALPLWRQLGHPEGEAASLNGIGRIYDDLGQKQQGLDYYNLALPLWRQVGNRSGVALALYDIGRIHYQLGRPQQALDFYNQALDIWREVQDHRGVAAALNHIGRAYADLGQRDRALDTDYQALAAWREVQDRRGQAFALATIGRVLADQGKLDQALPQKLAALSLAKAAGDPDLQGGIDASLMLDFRGQQRLEEAIFFGTEAVNAYQLMRRNISGLDQSLQEQFAQSKSATYRMLAELLLQANRLGEAEQVLDLLKEQELREVVIGAAGQPDAHASPLNLTRAEQQVESDLAAHEQAAVALTDLSAQYAALLGKPNRTPEESAQLKALETKIESGNSDVSDFFRKTLYPELAQNAGTQAANALLSEQKSEVSRLQNTLADLGPHVVGIRLLLGGEHAYAIVITPQSRKKYELKATPADLNDRVQQLRAELRTPSSDPKPHLAEMYSIVIAPLEAELTALERAQQDKTRVPTLLWSLDGTMRYLPMTALYDGHRYLAERFNNVLFTPESYGHMTSPDPNKSALRVLAMGLSKSYGGLPALPGVLAELDAVVHDPSDPESHGPLDGVLLPNERFTWAALKAQLGPGSEFPVVHIASHFVLEAGGGTEPYLMLGGNDSGDPQGFSLTLSQMENSAISFHGTRLLTLSACSTAKGDTANDGLEMDSLGMVAQQKDAEAVLATLWDVNDASTSRIMSDFYSRWVKDSTTGKAESLRQAQLAFLHGSPASAPHSATGRGVQVTNHDASTQATEYAHPYYWAPFVLIGNYQ